MEITKNEVEKLLGYEITEFKVTKKAYRGKKITVTLTVKPKNYFLGDVVVTIKPTKSK